MKDRSFADFMVGALACVSVLGFCAVVREADAVRAERRRALGRWRLPRAGGLLRTPEDDCRHCRGEGACEACGPSCRVCRGSGLQPRDRALVVRLDALWDGVR